MTLDTYQLKITEQREIEILNENLVEVLKFYVLFSDIKNLSFFEFNYELNHYDYSFTVNSKDKFVDDTKQDDINNSNYSIILEKNDTTYGMITFNENPGNSEINNELFEKIIIVLQKRFKVQKDLLSQDALMDIYIITDKNSKAFATKLGENLNILTNANIQIESSIVSVIKQLSSKVTKSILIYTVDDDELLKIDEGMLQVNEFLIVIGPSDYNLSLYCGHLDVFKYLSKENFVPEQLKNTIIDIRHKVQNKNENKNNIVAISGIAGGIGTTTIAMNMADLISQKNPNDNVLFVDLSKTKAISNLFLGKNPLPTKNIIDLVNSGEFDVENNLENGLVKVRENFFAINGIQKHIDGELLEQEVFGQKLLEYIQHTNEQFNYIIIDTGEASDTPLNSTIYEIANDLWILTEMSLPHISKLKTFFSLMKRAGLKDKLTFLVNRYDSANAISVSDVESILNTTNDDNLSFDLKIPNDYTTLGYCWNYCELATSTHKDSKFVNKLEELLVKKKFFKSQKKTVSKAKSWLSFLKKD